MNITNDSNKHYDMHIYNNSQAEVLSNEVININETNITDLINEIFSGFVWYG